MAERATRFHLARSRRAPARSRSSRWTTAPTGTKPNTFGRRRSSRSRGVLELLEDARLARPAAHRQAVRLRRRRRHRRVPAAITPELAREAGRAGHELFGALRELPFPTLAAINGAALGGGVEIALHCDYRTISSASATSPAPRSSSGSSPAGVGRSSIPRLVGAAARGRVHRREPAAPEPDADRPAGVRGRVRRRAARAGRVPRRVARLPRRRIEEGAGEAAAGRRSLRRRRGLPASALAGRRPGARRRAGPVPRARADRGRRRAGRSKRATAPRRTRSPSCSPARRRRRPSTPSTSSSGGQEGRRPPERRAARASHASASSAPV